MPNKKSSKIQQRHFDLQSVTALQNQIEERLSSPSDSSLRLDLMLAFSLLKGYFQAGFIERVDE